MRIGFSSSQMLEKSLKSLVKDEKFEGFFWHELCRQSILTFLTSLYSHYRKLQIYKKKLSKWLHITSKVVM